MTAYSRTVAMTASHALTVSDLSTFLAEIAAAGIDAGTAKITWSVYPGNRFEASQLTLTAVPGGTS